MEQKRSLNPFLIAALGMTLYLCYLVFKPFITSILLGSALSVVLYPLFERILIRLKGSRGISALLVCILSLLVVVIPLTILSVVLVDEITVAYSRMEAIIQGGEYREFIPFIENQSVKTLYERVSGYLTGYRVDLKGVVMNSLKQVSSYAVQAMTAVLANMALFILNIFLMMFTTYYLLKDSDSVANELRKLIPLTDSQKEMIFNRFREIIHATLYGSIASAFAQGLLGGLAFWVLGIGSPVMWGTVMAFLALLPMVGAFVIWFPASLLLIVKGSYVQGIILMVWGGLVISTIDNFIRPYFMSGRAMLHPLITFFGILGGMLAFGPIGLIAGPFLVALAVIFLDILNEVSAHSSVTDLDKAR